jgi:hypothetical protein
MLSSGLRGLQQIKASDRDVTSSSTCHLSTYWKLAARLVWLVGGKAWNFEFCPEPQLCVHTLAIRSAQARWLPMKLTAPLATSKEKKISLDQFYYN